MHIHDQVFIVTGGGSGLGAATAAEFVEFGARVAIFDRDAERAEQVAHDLHVQWFPLDVTDDEAVKQAVQSVVNQFGRLNGVVNCAGIGIAAKVLGKEGPHSLSAFQQVLSVNVVGTFNVSRWVAWAMKGQPIGSGGERGVIIQTASIAAFEGQIGQAAYSASKGAIVGMTLPLARELAQYGIRVMAIAPGIFDTPMLGMLPQAARESLGAQVPFPPRLGSPREYALLARHIVENPMLNGEVIRLDGAIRMAPR
ncbi:MAG: 3-hydroxyacyl-CoA dehydrogenase [Sulfobacillus acidophilus]|uniref:3-hydroxyacyl-CoA dehydrogenase n=1 Tax=Sulfobacillus acidophilus TaxID=53633 RepID=A0A2T2WGI7_9FIRM|nr:MAG: 3-hydroxyacyl-CoA dehydrogenase [Sulfobacillus acidophilus]